MALVFRKISFRKIRTPTKTIEDRTLLYYALELLFSYVLNIYFRIANDVSYT